MSAPISPEILERWQCVATGAGQPGALLHDLEYFTEADFVLPCGENCESAMVVNGIGMRTAAFPFDFLANCRPEAILRHLRDPDTFLPPFGDSLNMCKVGFGHYTAKTEGEHEALASKFQMRFERLHSKLTLLEDGARVILFHSCSCVASKQTPILDLVAIREHFCAKYPQVNFEVVSFRPRKAAERPEAWAPLDMEPQGGMGVSVRYVDAPPHGETWPERLPAHRACLCAMFGLISMLDLAKYPAKLFPHARLPDIPMETS